MSRLLITVGALSAALMLGRWALTGPVAARFPLTHEVRAVEGPIEVLATGDFEPVDDESILVPPRLMGVIDFIAPEGYQVAAGDMVLIIKTRQMEDEIRRASFKVKKKTKLLEKLIREDREKRAEEDNRVLEKLANLEHDQTQLGIIQAGPTPNERERDRLQIELANLEYERLLRRTQAQSALKERGFLSEIEFAKSKSDLDKSRLDVKKTMNLREMKEAGPRTEEIAHLTSTVEKFNREAELARSGAEKDREVRRLEIDKARAEIETAETLVDRAQQVLDSTHISTTTSGTVIYESDIWGSGFEKGSAVYRGQKVMGIGRTDRLKVVAHVRADDVKKVEIGQACRISAAGNKVLDLQGTVTSIASAGEPEDPGDPKGLKVFSVTIQLADIPGHVAAGMMAGVAIKIHEGAGLLRIPRDTAFQAEPDSSELRVYRIQPAPPGWVSLDPVLTLGDFHYINVGEAGSEDSSDRIAVGDKLKLEAPEELTASGKAP